MQAADLKFDERGLIPAIVVDTQTKQVLMLAYMNAESLRKSMETGRTCFWSRSRQELWTKGETSGNYQHIVSVTADCDADALLVEVRKDGPACHTGAESCFHQPVFEGPEPQGFQLADLYRLLEGRKTQPKEGSYTSYLFEKGTDKILKKVGEETTEVVIAAKDHDHANTVYELGDLLYHCLVLMVDQGISIAEICDEMAGRHVIDHKVKQEKMIHD
jgi:phosphoribosyl-ATP pyrophosphohydrolase/phosphoribosyl-AMP cyclohydrolase